MNIVCFLHVHRTSYIIHRTSIYCVVRRFLIFFSNDDTFVSWNCLAYAVYHSYVMPSCAWAHFNCFLYLLKFNVVLHRFSLAYMQVSQVSAATYFHFSQVIFLMRPDLLFNYMNNVSNGKFVVSKWCQVQFKSVL